MSVLETHERSVAVFNDHDADAEHLYREVRRYHDVAGLLQQLG